MRTKNESPAAAKKHIRLKVATLTVPKIEVPKIEAWYTEGLFLIARITAAADTEHLRQVRPALLRHARK